MKKAKSFIIKNRPNGKKEKRKYVDWESITVPDQQMGGEDIARYVYKVSGVKITRQNVSQSLKTAMKKFYSRVSKRDRTLTPFKVAITMMEMLSHASGHITDNDATAFFKLFPPYIRDIIEKDAIEIFSQEQEEEYGNTNLY